MLCVATPTAESRNPPPNEREAESRGFSQTKTASRPLYCHILHCVLKSKHRITNCTCCDCCTGSNFHLPLASKCCTDTVEREQDRHGEGCGGHTPVLSGGANKAQVTCQGTGHCGPCVRCACKLGYSVSSSVTYSQRIRISLI